MFQQQVRAVCASESSGMKTHSLVSSTKLTHKSCAWLPPDRCTPYDLNGRKDMDQMCADMAGWSDEHLAKLWNASAIPTAAEGFPLRGCSYRCVAGSNWLAQMAQRPMVNAGWSGKCFGFSLNQTTGTPLGLINQFSEHYDKRSLPSNLRVAGKVQGTASVFWDSTSIADGKPVWAFGEWQHCNSCVYARAASTNSWWQGYVTFRKQQTEGERACSSPGEAVSSTECSS